MNESKEIVFSGHRVVVHMSLQKMKETSHTRPTQTQSQAR